MQQNWKTPSGGTSPTCARYGLTSLGITVTAWWSAPVIRLPSRNCCSHITCFEPTVGTTVSSSRLRSPLSADWSRRGIPRRWKLVSRNEVDGSWAHDEDNSGHSAAPSGRIDTDSSPCAWPSDHLV